LWALIFPKKFTGNLSFLVFSQGYFGKIRLPEVALWGGVPVTLLLSWATFA
jgi:hypothetical protein